MIVRKNFEFLLKPTKKQVKILEEMLQECRWLYNELLEQRILAYSELEMPLTKYEQSMFLPELKIGRPTLEKVHSQVLQNVVDRLDKAFQGFFRRCKSGEKPGFPRFRGIDRYKSFCYPQSGFSIENATLKLSKVGNIKVLKHRPISGNIKTCTIKRESTGKWKVLFSCEVETNPLEPNERAVALDMGIENFAVLSDGEIIKNPRFFKKGEKKLAKAQKKLSKLEKGTKERKKQKKVVAKVHSKISNQRKDFCHKESKKIVEKYQYICIEDLEINRMVEKSSFAKSIMDVSWNQFHQFLTYKAAEAGRKLGLVNPAYTSQTCSCCKNVKPKELSERKHHCLECGYTTTRDFNAAQNILALGLDGLGRKSPRSPRL